MLYRGVRRLLCDKAVSRDLVVSAGIVAGCAYAAFLLRAVMEQPIKITALSHPSAQIFVPWTMSTSSQRALATRRPQCAPVLRTSWFSF